MMSLNFDSSTVPVDLSMPIEEHWRFAPKIEYAEQQTAGCAFHSTKLTMSAHAFTHVDAHWHIDPQGEPLRSEDLARLCGRAVLIDVAAVGDDRPITKSDLAAAGPLPKRGEIALIRTNLEQRHPTTTVEYWTHSPWLSIDAANWLAALGVAAVGYDFPQDRGIRAPYLDDWTPRSLDEDWACHRLLLRRDIPQIEYLTNLAAVTTDRCTLFAVPLRLSRSDGSPVRAFAYLDEPPTGDPQ